MFRYAHEYLADANIVAALKKLIDGILPPQEN